MILHRSRNRGLSSKIINVEKTNCDAFVFRTGTPVCSFETMKERRFRIRRCREKRKESYHGKCDKTSCNNYRSRFDRRRICDRLRSCRGQDFFPVRDLGVSSLTLVQKFSESFFGTQTRHFFSNFWRNLPQECICNTYTVVSFRRISQFWESFCNYNWRVFLLSIIWKFANISLIL